MGVAAALQTSVRQLMVQRESEGDKQYTWAHTVCFALLY